MARKKKSSKRIAHKKAAKNFDWIFLILVILVVMFGLLMVFDASVFDSFAQFGDKYRFVRLQAVRALFGFAAMIIAMLLPMTFVKKYSQTLFIATIILLILVLIPGFGSKIYGARRWISIGGIVIQPSEFAKLATAAYFPSWLIKHQRPRAFLMVLGILVGLLMLEPDLGTTLVVSGIAFSLYFISGVSVKKLGAILGMGIVVGSILIVSSSYRLTRLKTFLNPTNDPLGTSYHIRQVILGLGSGGLYGTGIGRSRQKYQYLPEATTDSIFAVIGEEVGFLGATLVILILLAIILRGLQRTAKLDPSYEQLVAVSVIAWITFQSLLNLGSMVVLIPLTGLPLPFISYGGSSLISMLAAVGLYLNATKLDVKTKI